MSLQILKNTRVFRGSRLGRLFCTVSRWPKFGTKKNLKFNDRINRLKNSVTSRDHKKKTLKSYATARVRAPWPKDAIPFKDQLSVCHSSAVLGILNETTAIPCYRYALKLVNDRLGRDFPDKGWHSSLAIKILKLAKYKGVQIEVTFLSLLLRCLCLDNKVETALIIADRMKEDFKCCPDGIHFCSILTGIAPKAYKFVEKIDEIRSIIDTRKVAYDEALCNALMNCYMISRQFDKAEKLFERLKNNEIKKCKLNNGHIGTMINGYAEIKDMTRVNEIVDYVNNNPDKYDISLADTHKASILKCCTTSKNCETGLRLLEKEGFKEKITEYTFYYFRQKLLLKCMQKYNDNYEKKMQLQQQLKDNFIHCGDIKDLDTSNMIANLIDSYIVLNSDNWCKAVKDIQNIRTSYQIFYWEKDTTTIDLRGMSNLRSIYILRYIFTYQQELLRQIFKKRQKNIYICIGKSGLKYAIINEIKSWKHKFYYVIKEPFIVIRKKKAMKFFKRFPDDPSFCNQHFQISN